MKLKSKQQIGNGLYMVAIVLLLVHCYQMGADKENSLISTGGYGMLLIAAVYHLWLSQEKKKVAHQESENQD